MRTKKMKIEDEARVSTEAMVRVLFNHLMSHHGLSTNEASCEIDLAVLKIGEEIHGDLIVLHQPGIVEDPWQKLLDMTLTNVTAQGVKAWPHGGRVVEFLVHAPVEIRDDKDIEVRWNLLFDDTWKGKGFEYTGKAGPFGYFNAPENYIEIFKSKLPDGFHVEPLHGKQPMVKRGPVGHWMK